MSASLARPRGLRSLQGRFMTTVVVGAVLFAVIAGTLAYRLGHERALASSRALLEGLARAVESTVAIGAYAKDPVLLREVVDGLARNELVASVEVRPVGSGAPRVHGGREAVPVTHAAAEGMTVERLLHSPFDAAEQVGVLRIRGDSARIGAVADREAYTQAALMIGQAALVALLLYGVAAVLVSRPIVRLARQLHGMSPGTDERLETPGRHRHDEIGVLIRAANALLESHAVALQRERALRAEIEAMEAQYRHIFDSSSAGIFVIDREGRLINGNPTVSRVVGMSLEAMRALRHDSFIQRVFGEPGQVRAMMEEAARSGETVSADLELVQRGTRRRWVHCLISVQGDSAEEPTLQRSTTLEGVIYDITERKHVETAVRYRAEHDALTGLKNRAASLATLERMVVDTLASGETLSVMCLDLDGFKQINDSFGHPVGDDVLVACAQRMSGSVRGAVDLVGRLGGDEFIIALRGVGSADAALGQTATAVLDVLHQPFALKDGAQAQLGASIGIGCLRRHGYDSAALIEAADVALYVVKRNGKHSFALALPLQEVVAPVPGPQRAETPRPTASAHRHPDSRPASLV